MSLLKTNRGKMASNPVQSDEETLQKSRSVSPASYRSSRASSAEAEGSDREGSRDDDTVSSGQGSSEEEEMIGGSGLQEESDSASDEGNVQEQGEDTRGNGPGESDNDLGSPDAWWKGVQEVTFGYFLVYSFMCVKCHFLQVSRGHSDDAFLRHVSVQPGCTCKFFQSRFCEIPAP